MILAALLLCVAAQAPVVDPAEAPPPLPAAPTVSGPQASPRALDVPDDVDPPPPPAPRAIFGDNGSLLDDDALVVIGAGATTAFAASAGYAIGLLGLLVGGSIASSTGNGLLLVAAFAVPPVGAAVGAALGALLFTPDLWLIAPALIAALGTTLAYGAVVLQYSNTPVALGLLGVGVVGGIVGAGLTTSLVVMSKRALAPVDEGE